MIHLSGRLLPRRVQAGCWRRLAAIGVAMVLGGCASSFFPMAADPRPHHASRTAPAAQHTRVLRIAQVRTGGGTAFRVVASEPLPTPKTLASVGAPVVPTAVPAPGPSASRMEAPARAPHPARHARVRAPVGTVHFAPGGIRVNEGELRAVAAAVARIGPADRVVLTARTDAHGSLEQNRRLAVLRGESVAAALAARGIDPAQVIVLSRPRCCASRSLPEPDAAPHRRVDIEILTQRVTLTGEPGDVRQPDA